MTQDEPVVVRTRHLVVGYAGQAAAAIPDVDFTGRTVWLVTGANGAGKTALLKTLAGLLPPISGYVERRCAMGTEGAIYVHSVPYVFAGRVRRNLMLTRPRQDDLLAVASTFGLSSLLDRDTSTLSHGQQRRLALARALVAHPSLLLVDEPEGGLDDEAMAAWRACAVRAVEAGQPVLVVAAHRPLAFGGLPVTEIHLSAPDGARQNRSFLLRRRAP
jgi:ABC-type molybdenum transport system ATPase subunit/photorepair protein PhrA